MKSDLTIEKLKDYCKENNKSKEFQSKDYPPFEFKKSRQTTYWIQFKHLFHRILTIVLRSPKAVASLFGIAVFSCFIMQAFYTGIGQLEVNFLDFPET